MFQLLTCLFIYPVIYLSIQSIYLFVYLSIRLYATGVPGLTIGLERVNLLQTMLILISVLILYTGTVE